MADWNKIKTEYITTNTSYRKLAAKHGISYQAICRKSQDEHWGEQREQYMNKTVTKALDKISKQQVDRAANLVSVADLLLAKVKSLVESDAEVLSDTQSLKHISGVLKDIKEVQMIRSDADMREQEARIANLRKQAEKEDKEKSSITITLEGGLGDYAQ